VGWQAFCLHPVKVLVFFNILILKIKNIILIYFEIKKKQKKAEGNTSYTTA
jgi:hypothetical protein